MIDEAGKAEYRQVKVVDCTKAAGSTRDLQTGKRSSSTALQRVRPGIEVKPELVLMPRPTESAGQPGTDDDRAKKGSRKE